MLAPARELAPFELNCDLMIYLLEGVSCIYSKSFLKPIPLIFASYL